MTHFLTRTLLSLTCFTLLGLTACNKAEESVPMVETQADSAQAETWEQFVARQIEAHIAAHPQWAVFQGRHEYDGQLPDWSRGALKRK